MFHFFLCFLLFTFPNPENAPIYFNAIPGIANSFFTNPVIVKISPALLTGCLILFNKNFPILLINPLPLYYLILTIYKIKIYL